MPEESPSPSKDEGSAPELPLWADGALTAGLILYVVVLAIATYAEVFENEAILRWFR